MLCIIMVILVSVDALRVANPTIKGPWYDHNLVYIDNPPDRGTTLN
jgi:hypothetical protein